MAVLLREAIGDSLRRERTSQSRTLREVSGTARVSLGYLSEVERGRKEASSELLAAICDALEVPLSAVLGDVSEALSAGTSAGEVPTAAETPAVGEGQGSAVRTELTAARMVISAPTIVRLPARAA